MLSSRRGERGGRGRWCGLVVAEAIGGAMVLILSLRLQGSKCLVQPLLIGPLQSGNRRSGLENKPKQETKGMETGQLDRIRCGS